MNDQSILVTMLTDIQGRLGRIEINQSDVVARVVKIEEHCTTCTPGTTSAPKSPAGVVSWLSSAAAVPMIKYALYALGAMYFLGRASKSENQVQNIQKALVTAKIQVDSGVSK